MDKESILDGLYEIAARLMPRTFLLKCFDVVFNYSLFQDCGQEYFEGLTALEVRNNWIERTAPAPSGDQEQPR